MLDKLSIIIPVYNEENTIEELIKRVDSIKINKEIIIIDDGSTDNTPFIISNVLLHKHIFKFFRHDINLGKGASIRTGLRFVTGDYVIIQDADLEYNPKDYFKMIKPVIEENADAVYGSRFLVGEYIRCPYFWRMQINKALTLVSNMFSGICLTDEATCYKLIKTSLLKSIILKENRFTFDPELTAKLAKKHIIIFEVPISYIGRTHKEGKKIRFKDGFNAVWSIIKYNMFNV